MTERIGGAVSADHDPDGVDLTPQQARRFPETAGSKRPFVEYELPSEIEEKLDKHQKRARNYMLRAARRIGDIYIQQQRSPDSNPREPFYPKGVSKSEILDAGRENPEIISPYTIVTRDKAENLEAIPQHVYYGETIKEKGIVDLLRNAAKEIRKSKKRDPQLESYLRARAIAFERGNFEASEAIWLTREDEPELNIVIGFYDTYTDRFLGLKYAAQAWVDFYDPETTEHVEWFGVRLLNFYQQRSGKEAPVVKPRVANLVIASGQAEPKEWTGNCLPCQPEWRKKHGSRLTIWKEHLENKFRDKKLPAFRQFVNPINVQGIQDSWLRLANLRNHAGHEYAHAFLEGENIDRLQSHKNWVKELDCDLISLVGYRSIEGLNPRESELAMALKLAESYVEYEERVSREEYHLSSTILFNYLIEKGNVWVDHGLITWSDTQQVFDDMDDFLTEIEEVVETGSIGKAREIRNRYFNPDVYNYLVTHQSYPVIPGGS